MNKSWQRLTLPPIEEMNQAREQCHQAIQNVAAVGRSFLPISKSDENASLAWDFNLQRLVGHWVEGDIVFRSSISIHDFIVYLVDSNFKTISAISMQNATQTDVMIWLEQQMGQLGVDFAKLDLAHPYEIPVYPTAKGHAFHVDNMRACQELSRLYHNASLMIKDLLKDEEKSTHINCWPHHFDITGSVILLDTGDPQTSRQIGIGLSPGDEHYNEPYFYTSPWPYPTKDLPDIDHTLGHWHENNWIGTVLPISRLMKMNLIQDQIRVIKKFYSESLTILKSM